MNNNNFEIFDGELQKYCGNDSCVVIPDTVTSIGDYAFAYNEIASLKLNEGLTTIYRIDTAGTSATSKVTLTKISIPTTKIDVEESILTSTLDDHGTSYYFRGNVQKVA